MVLLQAAHRDDVVLTEDRLVVSRWQLARVVVAALIGTTFDFYDFVVSGLAAAIVWPSVFFPFSNPLTAVLLSFSVYAVGLISRPLGNLLFAHFGDRMGRRPILIWTLLTSGLGTLAIALVPTYAEIGVSAAVLLTILRFIQAFGFGGEWGGATAWVAEFTSKSKYRGFWTGLVQLSIPLGTMMSAGIFLSLVAIQGIHGVISGGWRIPFYIGAAVILVGILIRLLTEESPLFASLKETKRITKVPSLAVWKEYPRILLKTIFMFLYSGTIYFTITVFSVSYLAVLGVPPLTALTGVLIATLGGVIAVIVGSYAGDTWGRKNMIRLSAALSLIFTVPYFLLINGRVFWIIILAMATFQVVQQFSLGNLLVNAAEYFPTRYRYSGTGYMVTIGSAVGGLLVTVVFPFLLTILKGPLNAWPYIAGLIVTTCVVTIALTFKVRETKGTSLED
ncbi:MAG: MFS transporter [Thermofilum sp.]